LGPGSIELHQEIKVSIEPPVEGAPGAASGASGTSFSCPGGGVGNGSFFLDCCISHQWIGLRAD
jgi:hypothetical protein